MQRLVILQVSAKIWCIVELYDSFKRLGKPIQEIKKFLLKEISRFSR